MLRGIYRTKGGKDYIVFTSGDKALIDNINFIKIKKEEVKRFWQESGIWYEVSAFIHFKSTNGFNLFDFTYEKDGSIRSKMCNEEKLALSILKYLYDKDEYKHFFLGEEEDYKFIFNSLFKEID